MKRNLLDALMAPASIAVFGASHDPSRMGGRPLQQLLVRPQGKGAVAADALVVLASQGGMA